MQMPDRKQNNMNRRQSMIVWLIALVILTTSFAGGVIAKYIKENSEASIVVAKEFYFTSNMLTEDCEEYVVNADTESITFTVGNNIDELRFSDDVVSYKVAADNGALLSIGESEPVAVLEGTLNNSSVSRAVITLSGLENNKEYEISATGSAGYSQTLSAKIKVAGTENNIYKYLDTKSYDEYVLLTVWTENLKGTVSIDFPAGMIPDNTDSVMKNVVNYDTGTGYAGKTFEDTSSFQKTYSSHTYRFFKNDINDKYNAGDFKVILRVDEESNYLAIESVPK